MIRLSAVTHLTHCYSEPLVSMSSPSSDTVNPSQGDRDVYIYLSDSLIAQRLPSLAQIQSRPVGRRAGVITRTRSSMSCYLRSTMLSLSKNSSLESLLILNDRAVLDWLCLIGCVLK